MMKNKYRWILLLICLWCMGNAEQCTPLATYDTVVTRCKILGVSVDGDGGLFPGRRVRIVDSCDPYDPMARLFPCQELTWDVVIPFLILSEDDLFCEVRQAYMAKVHDFYAGDVIKGFTNGDLVMLLGRDACFAEVPTRGDYEHNYTGR